MAEVHYSADVIGAYTKPTETVCQSWDVTWTLDSRAHSLHHGAIAPPFTLFRRLRAGIMTGLDLWPSRAQTLTG